MISFHKEMLAKERARDLLHEAAQERLARPGRARARDGSRRSALAIPMAFVRRLGRAAHAV